MARQMDPEGKLFRSKTHFKKIIDNLERWKKVEAKQNVNTPKPVKGEATLKTYFLYTLPKQKVTDSPKEPIPPEIYSQVDHEKLH